MILLPSDGLAESADGDTYVTYAVPAVHDMLRFPLETDEAVDMGLQLLPELPMALEVLYAEGHSSLPAVLYMGEHGDDMPLNIRTYNICRELSGSGKVVDSEKACGTIKRAENV